MMEMEVGVLTKFSGHHASAHVYKYAPNVAARQICQAPFSQHVAGSSLIAEGVQDLCGDWPPTALLLSEPQQARPSH